MTRSAVSGHRAIFCTQESPLTYVQTLGRPDNGTSEKGRATVAVEDVPDRPNTPGTPEPANRKEAGLGSSEKTG